MVRWSRHRVNSLGVIDRLGLVAGTGMMDGLSMVR